MPGFTFADDASQKERIKGIQIGLSNVSNREGSCDDGLPKYSAPLSIADPPRILHDGSRRANGRWLAAVSLAEGAKDGETVLDALRPAPLTVPTALTEPFGLVAPLGAVNLWLGVAGALAVAVLVLSWRLLYPKPRISVSDRGILDRNLGVGWIPWESVEGAYFPRTVEFQGVLLRLRPSPRLRKLGSKLGPSRTDGPPFEVRIDLADSEWNPVDLLQEILARTGAPASHVNAG